MPQAVRRWVAAGLLAASAVVDRDHPTIAALASSGVTELIGVHALFGAFVLGVIMPREGGVAQAMVGRLEDLVLLGGAQACRDPPHALDGGVLDVNRREHFIGALAKDDEDQSALTALGLQPDLRARLGVELRGDTLAPDQWLRAQHRVRRWSRDLGGLPPRHSPGHQLPEDGRSPLPGLELVGPQPMADPFYSILHKLVKSMV